MKLSISRKAMLGHLPYLSPDNRFSVSEVSDNGEEERGAAGPDLRISLPDIFCALLVHKRDELCPQTVHPGRDTIVGDFIDHKRKPPCLS